MVLCNAFDEYCPNCEHGMPHDGLYGEPACEEQDEFCDIKQRMVRCEEFKNNEKD